MSPFLRPESLTVHKSVAAGRSLSLDGSAVNEESPLDNGAHDDYFSETGVCETGLRETWLFVLARLCFFAQQMHYLNEKSDFFMKNVSSLVAGTKCFL